jgi:putative ABC transport system ATP-binding protein
MLNSNNRSIELKQVVKTYYSPAGAFMALKQIDLQINQGEFVAIIGKSGCGKSTLINMVTGIDRPTGGEVWVNGTAVHTLSESEMSRWRGRQLGIVFQFFQLLPTLTLAQNVKLPMDFCHTYPKRERHQRAVHLLDLMGVAEQADKLPSAVSGGQQQRAAIARALANDPPILVADEPTGNLDSQSADRIFTLFEDLVAEGKSIVIVTHDREQSRRVQRAIQLSDGVIISDGIIKRDTP